MAKYNIDDILNELGLLARPRYQLAERCADTLAALADRKSTRLNSSH